MNLLQKLDGREWQVIVLRFGLMDGDFKSIAEISEDLSINRQQIRHIESEVMNEFRQSDHIKQMLGELENREQLVIAMRFGLTDGTPKTLKDVSEVFHLTIGRVRQIERAALRKLIYISLGAPFRYFDELIKERRARRARILRRLDGLDKLRHVTRELAQEFGRNPNIDEIAARAEMTLHKTVDILRIGQELESLEKVRDAWRDLAMKHHRQPSIGEIAERLEMTSEEVKNALDLDQDLWYLHNPEIEEIADCLEMGLDEAGRSEMTWE